MPPITSAQNARIQQVRALLTQRKAREAAGEFAAEGVRLVEEGLSSGWQPRLLLYAEGLSERGLRLLEPARAAGAAVEEVAPALLKSLSDTENPQGILTVFARRDFSLPQPPHFVVIADALRDPGNLGTLLRSAAAAGAQAAVLAPGTADAFAPKTLRAGMGAHFRLPVFEWTWEEIGARLRSACRFLVSESAEGVPCWQLDLTQPLALVIGGEAEGAGPQALAQADERITIPMPGQAESLNAAVAAGILLFEVVRQRSARR